MALWFFRGERVWVVAMHPPIIVSRHGNSWGCLKCEIMVEIKPNPFP